MISPGKDGKYQHGSFTNGLMKWKILVHVLAILLSAGSTKAQTGKLTGRILDVKTNDPVEGAVITIEGTDRATTSGIDGGYLFLRVASGTYTLRVDTPGYESASSESVRVNEGETTTTDILLSREVVPITPRMLRAQHHLSPGHISGIITDVVTGLPVEGALVSLAGTVVTTSSDRTGSYTFLLDPGAYSLKAAATAYQPVSVDDILILSGEQVEVDIVIHPSVEPGSTRSQQTIRAAGIRTGRYQTVTHLISAQAGAGSVSAFDDRPGIRGSGFNESLFLVDGIRQGDVLTNRPYYRVNLDAVQEVTIQRSGFSAAYGDVRSGIVEVTTKEGGERYSGSVNVQYSAPGRKHFGPMMYGFDSPIVRPFVDPDAGAFTGNAFFDGWDQVVEECREHTSVYNWETHEFEMRLCPHEGQPVERYALWLWRHRSPDAIEELKELQNQGIVTFPDGTDPDDLVFQNYGIHPDYRASLSLGGPAPILSNTTFFLSYDREQTEYAYRFAEPGYNDNFLRGKLTSRIGKHIKLVLSGYHGTQTGGDGINEPDVTGWISNNPFQSSGNTNRLWYPDWASPEKQTRQMYSVSWIHTVSPELSYQLNGAFFRNDFESLLDYRRTAPLYYEGETYKPLLRYGLIGTEDLAARRVADGEYGWENWRDWARIRIGDVWYDEAPRGYGYYFWEDVSDHYRMESGSVIEDNDTYVRGTDIRGSLSNRLNEAHRIRAGFELQTFKANHYTEGLWASCCSGYRDDYSVRPWKGAFYVEDQITRWGLHANLGLRADWMIHGKYPILDGTGDEVNGPYSFFLRAGETDQLWEEIPLRKARAFRISPRVGFSFPIREKAKVYVNYGHFSQWPAVETLYRIRYDTRRGQRVSLFGNPLLRPPSTIAFELGYKHNVFDALELNISAYYRDIKDEIADTRFYPEAFGDEGYYSQPQNLVYRDVRGVEASLELRRGVFPFFSGWIHGNYVVESGGLAGVVQRYEDPDVPPVTSVSSVESPDVRPLVKGNLLFSTPETFGPGTTSLSLLGGIDVSLLFTWKLGGRFTWNPDGYAGVVNNIRWRPYQRWDLRLSKRLVTAGRFESVVYLDVTNLFNRRNMTPYNVYQDVTNSPDWAWDGHIWFQGQFLHYMESLDLEVLPGGTLEGKDRPGDWKADHIDLPDFSSWLFLERRDVYFGLKIYF